MKVNNEKAIEAFDKLATRVTKFTGTPGAFLMALFLIIAWAITGPIFHFSESWQLVINTGTTIVTFIMVFIIQYSQNKDTIALHMKIDELIKASEADNKLRGIENLSEKELEELKSEADGT